MINEQLNGKRVAILATNGFEQSELMEPLKRLKEEGAEVHVLSIEEGKIRGWHKGNWAMDPVHVTKKVKDADPVDYHGLVLPGGVMNPDALRVDEDVLTFVRDCFRLGMPVAAICHAPWTLINAEVVEGRKMTSYPTLRKDLENAGADWVDEEVVVDSGLITSRNPGDIPAFNDKIVEEVLEGMHMEQAQSMI